MMSEANSLTDAVRLLEQKVHDLIERLSFQRAENAKLKRRVFEAERAKMILEEEVGVLNRKLGERRDHFSRLGSVQQNDEIEQELDRLIKELQECIDEMN
jgi:regulator of replication initiation timing